MRILVIDNNRDPDCWGAIDLRVYALKQQGATVYTRRGFHDDLPRAVGPEFFDRTVISGSGASCLVEEPWTQHLDDWIRRTINLRRPLLGICYGHQALCRSLGGLSVVRKADIHQLGWAKIQIEKETPLLRGLSRSFYSFATHYEEVKSLPPGMVRLASSVGCEIEGCQVEGLPVYGLQFHPEKPADSCQRIIDRAKKDTGAPLNLLEDTSRYYDPKVGDLIFENFLRS